MGSAREVVITGMGIVSPIGTGRDAFWSSLVAGRSGVVHTTRFDGGKGPTCPVAGEVRDYDAKQYVKPRKNIKVMGRDIQLAVGAADMACKDARLDTNPVNPDRLGVSFGADLIPCELDEMVDAYRGCIVDGKFDFKRWGDEALPDLFPLWMLKYLPNMPACHIAISQDARGPNNSLTLAEVSSLTAIGEAMRVIQRGQADAIIAGGTSSRIHPTFWVRRELYEVSHRMDDPAAVSRPFDADRDGLVLGEGAAAFVLEERQQALNRGARILGRLMAHSCAFEPLPAGAVCKGDSIRRAIQGAMNEAGLKPAALGHVNAHGASTPLDDQVEAQAIHDTLDGVPVTAPKSYFGCLGAGTGAVEMAVSVVACQEGLVPATLNYQRPDPRCPVNVVRGEPLKQTRPTALLLNHARDGRATALVVAGE